MKKLLPALALALFALPVAAPAQQFPGDGPPPEVRAQMEQARTDAKNNAMNALSADHRAKVQAIVSQVENGSLSREDASKQIDRILTPQEQQAVLGQMQKMRDAMHAAMAARNNDGGPGGPGGPPGAAQRRAPDAGRFLLMLNGHRPSPPPQQP